MTNARGGTALLALAIVFGSTFAAVAAGGHVFHDLNLDGVRDPDEPGVAHVSVSNGRDVVLTGDDGSYRIGLEQGDVLFVTKPSGYAVPRDEHNLPVFYYVHDPAGTPGEMGLRYAGVPPTGPAPDSIDFPLERVDEPDRFRVILFADPQPQTVAELEYMRDDVIDELVGVEAAFGITLGDIVYDDLSMYPRYNRIVSQVGIPWYNVAGNHDLNALAPNDRYSLETFKRTYGPPYYSFDYGEVHFVVLDDVDYLGSNAGMERPHARGQGLYEGRISPTQLAWLERDLSHVPQGRLVVVAMHIPFSSFNQEDNPQRHVANRAELFALLAERERVFAVAGHMHTAEHHYFGPEEGFAGSEPLHQHVIATVSGSWWSGPFDEHGIPTTWQRDGTPNGYYVMTVDGSQYALRFKAAGKPAGYQMQIMLDSSYHRYNQSGMRDFRMGQLLGSPIDRDQVPSTEVLVNLFDGGEHSRLVLRIDDRLPVEMKRVIRNDPFIEELFLRNAETRKPWVKVEPTSHLWAARLPADLAAGVHRVHVRASDEYGRIHEANRVLEIVDSAGGGSD